MTQSSPNVATNSLKKLSATGAGVLRDLYEGFAHMGFKIANAFAACSWSAGGRIPAPCSPKFVRRVRAS
jgi:hypothetical protein